jgi:hypothetical protein
MFLETTNPSEIQPPVIRCAYCGGELEIFNDPKTNTLTRHRRRALMKCTRCGELQVTADPIFEKKRHRIAKVIAWVGAILFLIVEIVVEYVRFTEDPLSGPWLILGMLTLSGAVLMGLVCMYAVQVILPGDAKDRLGAALLGLMLLTLLLGFLWMLHKSPRKLSLRNMPNPSITPSRP